MSLRPEPQHAPLARPVPVRESKARVLCAASVVAHGRRTHVTAETCSARRDRRSYVRAGAASLSVAAGKKQKTGRFTRALKTTMGRFQPSHLRAALSPAMRQERLKLKRERRHLNAFEEIKKRQEMQLEHLQNEVDVVVELTGQNLDDMLARGERVEDLEARAGRLEECADDFKKHNVEIRHRMRCNNAKACVAVIIALIVVTGLFVGVGVFLWKKSEQVTNPSAENLLKGAGAGSLLPGAGSLLPDLKLPSVPNPDSLLPNLLPRSARHLHVRNARSRPPLAAHRQ